MFLFFALLLSDWFTPSRIVLAEGDSLEARIYNKTITYTPYSRFFGKREQWPTE